MKEPTQFELAQQQQQSACGDLLTNIKQEDLFKAPQPPAVGSRSQELSSPLTSQTQSPVPGSTTPTPSDVFGVRSTPPAGFTDQQQALDAYGRVGPRTPLTPSHSLEEPFPMRPLHPQQQQQPPAAFGPRFPTPAPRVADPFAAGGGKPRVGQPLPPPPPHMMQQVQLRLSLKVTRLFMSIPVY